MVKGVRLDTLTAPREQNYVEGRCYVCDDHVRADTGYQVGDGRIICNTCEYSRLLKLARAQEATR